MDYKKMAYAVGAAAAVLLAVAWLYLAYPAADWEMDRQMAPTIKEAKNLALDYEKVVSGKSTYIGKHVFWCVQNISEHEVFYRADMNARLAVSNYGRMPRFPGGKHMGCTEMLLDIEDVRKTPSGTGIVAVAYIYSR
ncbi:MAG: hypothetical protein A2X28_02900 [Elusimicrobia bacterium GWA2_56_46]|nr:MAG: hypothetical protein A2X28_02900 [Elusimicrobia bacterium GWA2_56_46]OGR54177.1 MAG: hypothetical protein A2X39_08845 [Elusimicrobia bacterium GWC2_56_31]HBB68245.1 hypothetical protein [Elusimicrobiota bacterium]HBW21754.1 hypothetical protein [Elusimicrobiota bacterium]